MIFVFLSGFQLSGGAQPPPIRGKQERSPPAELNTTLALWTLMLCVRRVNQSVPLEVAAAREGRCAQIAPEQFDAGVADFVTLQVHLLAERNRAHITAAKHRQGNLPQIARPRKPTASKIFFNSYLAIIIISL